MLIRLAIDFEHPSQTWWENGGRELWESIGEGFDENVVILDQALAKSWLSQAEQIPGWNEGPEHAPHPIAMSEVGEDEVLL